MVKRCLAFLTVTMLLIPGMNCAAKSSDAVRDLFAKAVGDIAGADSGSLLETSEYTLSVLEELDAWYVNITDDFISLETTEGTYVFDDCRDDGLFLLAKGLGYKYTYDEFVDEEIIILVGREDIGNMIVNDDNFSEYLEAIAEAGYVVDGPDAGEHIEAIRDKLEENPDDGSDSKSTWDKVWKDVRSGKGSSSGSSGGFQNDIFIEAPKQGEIIEEDGGGYAPDSLQDEDDYCSVCYGTGTCQICLGRGYYFNSYDLTQAIECVCYGGKCSSCD